MTNGGWECACFCQFCKVYFQTPFTYKHRLLQADCNGLINIVSRNLEFTFRALSSTERATTVKFKGGVEKK